MAAESERSPAVSIRGLRQGYASGWFGRREVLHGIDLEVARGAVLGLVGPNGSGKSTLLRVIAGIDEADEGEVRVLGRDPDSRETKAAVGFCPEESPFPPELKPLAALDLILSLYGVGRRERRRRAEEMLGRVGLSRAAHQRLGGFSRGMLRRFGIAQALIHQPELILLDEPTAGLDAPGFEAADALLDEALGRGATLIVSSHLLSDLQRRCERIVVLVDGRIVAAGAPAELVEPLGAAASLDLTVSGLDRAAIAELAREIERRGGRFAGAQPSQANLLELYRRGRANPSS